MVATSRAFWLTLLAILATTGAAPAGSPVAPMVESPVYTPPVTPASEDPMEDCVTKCHLYIEKAFPACHGRFTSEEYSPKSLCHTFGYVCMHACMYKW